MSSFFFFFFWNKIQELPLAVFFSLLWAWFDYICFAFGLLCFDCWSRLGKFVVFYYYRISLHKCEYVCACICVCKLACAWVFGSSWCLPVIIGNILSTLIICCYDSWAWKLDFSMSLCFLLYDVDTSYQALGLCL